MLRRSSFVLLALSTTLAACVHPTTDGKDPAVDDTDVLVPPDTDTPVVDSDTPQSPAPLQILHRPDAAAALRGETAWKTGGLSRPLIPEIALENLWIVWGGRLRPPGREALITEFVERYGLAPSPDPTAWPYGLVDVGGGMFSVDCRACHTGVVADVVVEGVNNSLVDLEALYDDLVRLSEVAGTWGLPEIPIPWDLNGLTAAPGTHDAMGLGMSLSVELVGTAPGIATSYGFQQSPALWTLASKRRAYTDGSGSTDGHRTMAAMTLAFGFRPNELDALDQTLLDVQAYLWSLPSPAWPFSPPDPDAVERGRGLFIDACASCHGRYDGDAFPDVVADVGTDPTRHTELGAAEVTWVNASWFADVPMEDTDGYLAPSLLGVWATAPYLHNGSVPDLAALLDPDARPRRWHRAGAYNPERVGWGWQAGGVYDTSSPGLSAEGHVFTVPAEDRADLLTFLTSL